MHVLQTYGGLFRRSLRALWKVASWAGGVGLGCLVVGYGAVRICDYFASASLNRVREEAALAGMALQSVLDRAVIDKEARRGGAAFEAAAVLAQRAYDDEVDAMLRVESAAGAPFGTSLPNGSVELLGQFWEDRYLVRLLAAEAISYDDAAFEVQFSDVGVCPDIELAGRSVCLGNMVEAFAAYEQASGKEDAARWAMGFVKVARAFRVIPHARAFDVGRCRNDFRAKKVLELLLGRGELNGGSLLSLQRVLLQERLELSAAQALRGTAALMLRQAAHLPESLIVYRSTWHPGAPVPARGWWEEKLPALAKLRYVTQLEACVSAYQVTKRPLPQRYQWAIQRGAGEGAVDLEWLKRLSPADTLSFTFACTVYAEVKAHAVLALAETACALERYRMMHGRWPADLRDLSPDFLGSVPPDPYDGADVKYEKTPYGVVLYTAAIQDKAHEGVPLPSRVPDYSGHDLMFALLECDLRGRKAGPEFGDK